MQKATFQRKYMLQDLERYKIEIFSWPTSCTDCKLREECLRKKETKRRYLLIPLEKHGRDFSKEMTKKIDTEEERQIYSEMRW